jgi:hypothetical protein
MFPGIPGEDGRNIESGHRPVFVDDQGVGEGTDLDETIPITARACQAGSFQAQDGPGSSQADLGDEVLKSIATGR